ncbi:MAG: DNA polymerase Y family protein [Hyphomicrobiales bacterium]|nr:DNA polymerase Y family protein [Hyphomicrobiales bacterium]
MPRYLSIFLAPPEGAVCWPQSELVQIALWHQRYTPLAAADAPDGIMLDVTGAAHLFGGEKAMMARIERDCRARNLSARTGLAPTPEAAWALARFGEDKARLLAPGAANDPQQQEKVQEKYIARAVVNLPMAALRLDAGTVSALSQTGLKRIGDIIARPRAPLTARFGKNLFARLDAMLGRAKSPISPQFEAPAYIAERRFADGIVARDLIETTIRSLARDLADMLERHDEGARRLMAALFRADGKVMHVECSTSRPLRDTRAIARLFHEKIDAAAQANASDPLDAGYGFDVIRLAVMHAEPLREKQIHLPQEQHGRQRQQGQQEQNDRFHNDNHPDAPEEDLALFLDRMSARYGADRVLRFTLNDTHIPEHAVIAAPAVGYRKDGEKRAAQGLLTHDDFSASGSPARQSYTIARPIRLLEKAEPVDAIATVPDGPPLRFRWRRVLHEVVAYEGPERIAPQWWRQEDEALTRDYFRVENTRGHRFWLYREGLYTRETRRPRWFLHGLFG